MLFRTARIAMRASRALNVRAATVAARPAIARPMMGFRHYSAEVSPSGLSRQEIEKRIVNVVKAFDKVEDATKITSNANFVSDLGLDSLDTVEVVCAIEEEFGIEIPDKESDEIKSIANAVDYIFSQPEAN
ncbi:acyl carrier protein, mitochondrial [Trichomonascus vanleenenianus]|uniref:acyl carrier protein n=1 Tax=Trichomonascus vanleenenianus TaxID=2268995 RepID=UPI003ECAE61B